MRSEFQPHTRLDIERFWEKVDTQSGQCWNWLAAKAPEGYGVFWTGKRLIRATHFAWGDLRGPVPGGSFLLHKCDNPRCVNPEHLFLGTAKENSQDAMRKGRLFPIAGLLKGEDHPEHKLTWQEVREIRAKYRKANHPSFMRLAREYRVSKKLIVQLIYGRTWKDDAVGGG